jgi:hypothetical protein
MTYQDCPILVTGIHRSGTTFVGRILALAPGVRYIQEPFNPEYGIRGMDTWYPYIWQGMPEEGLFAGLVEELLSGKAVYKERPGTHGGPIRTLGRKLFRSGDHLRYLYATRLPGSKRLLIKDPIAAMSSLWLHRRFGMKVVVLVRHPAAFTASTARLGWDFDFSSLTGQKTLLTHHLASVLNGSNTGNMAHHERAALLWRCVYTVLDSYCKGEEGMRMFRMEDISRAPIEWFEEIHRFIGLPFTQKQQRRIEELTGPSNPVKAPEGRVHSMKRYSLRLADAWRNQLERETIDRIMELAGPLASKYYPD